MSRELSVLEPDLLERMRRSIPFRMDRMGNFFVGTEAVTHPRIIDLLRNGLDITDSGEPTIHVGSQWCYLTVEDCFFRALAIDHGTTELPGQHDLLVYLDDGRKVSLELDSLWEEPDQGLRCTTPAKISGRLLSIRFSNNAQMDLSQWIHWEHNQPKLVLRDFAMTILATPASPQRD